MTASISNITFGRLAASAFTRDIQLAHAFYRDVLDFEKTFQNGDPVGFMILEKDAAELHLSLVRDHHPSTTNIAHLMVDNVDALHDRLVAAGVRIIKSLADKDYGLRAFVFADPDGNRIDVGQPTTPAAPPRFAKRNMAGATFDDVNLANAVFGDVNLAGARLANVNLSGVSIDDARIDGLTLFGMDIQALIRAELARRRGD
ncbi:VOC family protein [Caulobacter sp. RL271]|uniref:VOC family protein n=1 Tax=Caulobacter segnis TaxID=88688 RepID=A0ABY4ZQI6_9CAUL|nr:VOC family protein [Caulobacter segnis]USQ94795.1 VOC family protein [Caulobacter segnis]